VKLRKIAPYALAVLLMVSTAFTHDLSQVKAAAPAGELLERAKSVGADGIVPIQELRGAAVREVHVIHHPETLMPAYAVVTIRSADGRLVGLVGVDAEQDRWLWCTLSYPHEDFPAVSEARARRLVEAERRSLGLAADAGCPVLIQGCDKHLYWHFGESGSERWLVDADGSRGRVLRSSERAFRRATTPQEEQLRPTIDRSHHPELSPHADNGVLTATTPPAYNMPGIPYHFQITSWYCGPASLQMILDYYGEEIGQHNIADVANDVVGSGCARSDMRRCGHFSAMSTAIQDPMLQGYTERELGYACMETIVLSNPGQKLKNTVYAQYPVFILTWYDASHTSGHYRVVKGYDDSLNVFILHDPWYAGALCGPDVLIAQDYLVDDLWDYSDHWCMVACPWELTPGVPTSVSVGDTFAVDLQIYYPGPTRFAGQFPCSDCEATISLSAGLALAGGSPTVSLPGMISGDTAWVSWDVAAIGPEGDWGVAFQAQGVLTATSSSYPSYTDSIGGHAYETVQVTDGVVAGWSDEEHLTSGDASSQTCFPGARAMVVGDTGDVHLVWSDTRDGTNEVYYRMKTGAAWQPEVKLSETPGFSTTPCIARGPDGRLHVAWVDSRDGNNEIYYKYWDPIGGWSPEERVTNYGEVDYCPAIAAGDTAIYLAWERRMGGAYRVAAVHFSMRTAVGWTAPHDVDASPARDSYRPSLAYGPDGVLYLAYERQTANTPDEHEKVVLQTWDGLSWSGRTGISTDVSFSRYPCIAVGRDSTVHLVWQDGENLCGSIYYTWYDGTSWQAVEQLTATGIETTTPSVAVDRSGTVHIVWSDHRHRDSEIYYIAREDTGWIQEMRLTSAAGHSLVPTIAARDAGEVCVVWSDLRNVNADLYFRALDDQSGITVAETLSPVEQAILLLAPYPMPFTSGTRISFVLAERSEVALRVFDVEGRLVATLAHGMYDAGIHRLRWDGRTGRGHRAASGVYFVHCAGPLGRDTRRVVLVN
jgi:hypothetical protein